MTFGRRLVVLHTMPSIMGDFWCMPGGSVEVWTKNILYRFMKDHAHFSTSWHANFMVPLYFQQWHKPPPPPPFNIKKFIILFTLLWIATPFILDSLSGSHYRYFSLTSTLIYSHLSLDIKHSLLSQNIQFWSNSSSKSCQFIVNFVSLIQCLLLAKDEVVLHLTPLP